MFTSRLIDELHGENPILALESFLKEIEKENGDKTLILDFLEVSPNCDDILQLLSRNQLKQAELATVYNVLRYILFSLTENAASEDVCLHITRWVLQNQNEQLVHILSDRNTSPYLVASTLHFIAGMVLSSNATAKEVLTCLEIGSINFSLLAEKKSRNKKNDVRTPLIYLILAFLNTNDANILRQFLQNVGLVTCIFKGLSSDPSELVVKILILLHEVVVLNMQISKTLKTKLFNPNSCKELMNLYFHYYPEDAFKNSCYLPEEKEKIKKTLHQLMVTLCSDVKHGIVFKEENNKQLKDGNLPNMHTYLILRTLSRPWEFEEGRELICKVATLCPTIPHLLMNPKDCPSLYSHSLLVPNIESYSLLKFTILLHEKIAPWKDLERQIQKGPVESYKFLIRPLSVGYIYALIESKSHVLRHVGIMLLLTVCNKAKETINQINQKAILSNLQKSELKDMIIDEIKKICKGINKVANQWSVCLSSDESKFPDWYRKDYPTKFSMLADIADFFCVLADLFGFSYIKEKIDPVARLIEILNLAHGKAKNISYHKVVKLIIELLLVGQRMNDFESSGFLKGKEDKEEHETVNETLFFHLINLNLNFQNDDNDASSQSIKNDLQKLSLKLLSGSFVTWGLSSYCDNMVTMWINHIPFNEQNEISKFLAKVIAKSITNMFVYLDVLISLDLKHEMKGYSSISLAELVSQIESDDNENIKGKEITVPFSFLVLAALDVLKETCNPNLMKYFSNVIEDYISFIENPKSLGEYVLKNENFLILETKQYLRAYIHKEFVETAIVSEDTTLTKLKILFMTGNYSHVSHFCTEWLNDEKISSDQLVSVCRHILLYLQSEHKKPRKFSLAFLGNLLDTSQTDSNSEKFHDMFYYLISHPFILGNYQLFKSSDIHTMVEKILSIVIGKYPALHSIVKCYLDKAITELKLLQVHEIKEWHNLSVYLSKYTLLTYDDLERLIEPLVSTSLPYSERHIILLCELLHLLIMHTHASYQPSEDLIKLFLSKLVSLSQQKEISDPEKTLIMQLSNILSLSLTLEMIQNLKSEELKKIFALNPFNSRLCCRLVRIKPSIACHLPKLTNADLPSLAPFVAELLKMEKFNRENVHLLLRKLKKDLLVWVWSSSSKMNDSYGDILTYMIQKNMIELSDVKQMHNKFFDEIVTTKQQLPAHFLSIIPLFDLLATDKEDCSHPNNRLLYILLHGIMMNYKKCNDSQLIGKLVNTINLILEKNDSLDISRELPQSKIWASFVKQVLKVGPIDPINGPHLLKLITQFCAMIYNKESDEEWVLPPATMYQMLRSHSQYTVIMFNQEEHEEIKEQLVLLQLQLVTLHPSICEERHVPLLLGSYGATRSTTDQGIFKLLHFYEEHGFMNTYKPILWGPFAATYLAVEKGPGVSTRYTAPNHHQILALLEGKKVIRTALHFDMTLQLEPSLHGNDRTLYDQRFLLVLFSYITSENLEVDIMELIEKGVVAIAIAALSSHVDTVWAVGAKLLSDVVFFFQESSYYNLKHQWIWFVHILAGGLKTERRIPSLMVHFLVKASQLFSTPENLMYEPVMNYIWLRPALPLFQVPEMYLLLFSEDTEHNEAHQTFILELLASGIRDELDWDVCQSSYLAKLLVSIVTSTEIITNVKVLCLQVLKAMVEIPCASKNLVLEQSLMVELPLALESPNFCPVSSSPYRYIDAVVSVLTSFWKTWRTLKDHSIAPQSSSLKRKAKENIQNILKTKKRKLLNEKVITREATKDAKIGEKSSFSMGCNELFVCMERILSTVISEGTVASLCQCFRLLNEILACTPPNGGRVIYMNNLLKQRLKSWLDASLSSPRFQNYQPHELESAQKWKHKPLTENIEVEDESKNHDDFKVLHHVTKELLSLLNKQNPS